MNNVPTSLNRPQQLQLWKATLSAAAIAPIINPWSLQFFASAEASWHPIFLGVAFFLYLYALMLAMPGALIFSAIVWYRYEILATKPWWVWGLLGGVIGVLLVALSPYIDPRVFGSTGSRALEIELPGGALSGFAAGVVFRRVFLR